MQQRRETQLLHDANTGTAILMNDDSSESLAISRKIDKQCDQFEQDWIAGNRPHIEKYMEQVPGHWKPQLLLELIAIEMYYRHKLGETVAIADYQSRFPGLSEARLHSAAKLSVRISPRDSDSGNETTIEARARQQPVHVSNPFEIEFSDYKILDTISQGGMGIVFRARQISLNRIVAIKMILSGEFATKQEIERFYTEAKAAALLDHPGIVPVYEVGEKDGRHFFSMAYIEGTSLSSRLSAGPMEPRDATSIVRDVAEAVQYAHQHGIIHRDLKPSNILLDRNGRPRVTDFGLAKRTTETDGITVSGQVLGTPSYMPPEQAAGQVDIVGPASDVYALGAILYSLITGRPPFQAASSVETIRQVVERDPVTPRQLNPSIPRDLETIVLKCIEKALPKRYSSAQTLIDELDRFLEGRPIQARPVSRLEKLWRWCKREPKVASLTISATSLIIGLAIITTWAYFREVDFRNDLKRSLSRETAAKLDAIAAGEFADRARVDADRARIEKEQQAEIAQQERDRAKESESAMRHNLYRSDVQRANEAIQQSNYARASEILERHVPNEEYPRDLRSFDWHYLQNRIHRPERQWQFEKPVEVVAISRDKSSMVVGCEGGTLHVIDLATGKSRHDGKLYLDETHWSTIGFRSDGAIIGQGTLGSIKFWDSNSGQLISHKPSEKSLYLQSVNRIPAAIRCDGAAMLGCDPTRMLALWDLNTLRFAAIPFLNDGLHYMGLNTHLSFHLDMAKHLSAIAIDRSRTVRRGFSNSTQQMLSSFAEQSALGYRVAGVGQSLLTKDISPKMLGHPLASIVFGLDRIACGSVDGQVSTFHSNELADPFKWVKLRSNSVRLSQHPILSIAQVEELDLLVACDEEHCWVLNGDSLEVLFETSSPTRLYRKVQFAPDGQFFVGRQDGVVETWSIFDESKVQEYQTGAEAICDIQLLDDKAVVVANRDGFVSFYSRSTPITETIPSPGFHINSSHKASVFWLNELKYLAVSDSEKGELCLIKPNILNETERVRTRDDRDLIVSSDWMSDLELVELPNSKKLLGVSAQSISIFEGKPLAKSKSIDITEHIENGARYSLRDGRHLTHKFLLNDLDEFVRFDLPVSILDRQPMTAMKILASSVFPDERRICTLQANMYGKTENRVPLRLVVRDLVDDQVRLELFVEGTNVKEGEVVIAALDQDRILIDGVYLTGRDHPTSLVFDMASSSIHQIHIGCQSYPWKAYSSIPKRKALKFSSNESVVAIVDPHSLRIVEKSNAQVLVDAKPSIESTDDEFEFVHMDSDQNLWAVVRVGSTSTWKRWDCDRNLWEIEYECRGGSKFSIKFQPNFHWSLDDKKGILYHRAYDLDNRGRIQRWFFKTGLELPTINIPVGEASQLETDSSGTTVVFMEHEAHEAQRSRPQGVQLTHWFQVGSPEMVQESYRSHASKILGKSDQRYFMPLSSTGCWLTFDGWHGPRPPHEMLTIEGKAVTPQSTAKNIWLLSADSKTLVELSNDIIQTWRLANEDNSLPLNYKLVGKHPFKQMESTTAISSTSEKSSMGIENAFGNTKNGLRLSGRGKFVFQLNDNGLRYSKLPFDTWTTISSSSLQSADVVSAEWSIDEDSLFLGTKDGRIMVYSAIDGRVDAFVRGHQSPINALEVLPDGKTIVSGGQDGQIVIWDIERREIRLKFDAHRGGVNDLSWNNALGMLVSCGKDGIVRNWMGHSREKRNSVADVIAILDKKQRAKEERLVDPNTLHEHEIGEWLESKGAIVKYSSFGIGSNSNSRKSGLDQLGIDSIEFVQKTSINPSDVAKLNGLKDLRTLRINCPHIKFADLKPLNDLPHLNKLEFINAAVQGSDLELLSSFPLLRTIGFNNGGITDEHVSKIVRLHPTLIELDLARNSISDAAMESISELKSLHTIQLSNTNITDVGCAQLGDMQLLKTVNVSDCKVTSEGLRPLGKLQELNTLVIRNTGVNGDLFRDSVQFSRLVYLDIRGNPWTDANVISLLKWHENSGVFVSPDVFSEGSEARALAQLGRLMGTVEVDGKKLGVGEALSSLMSGGSVTGLTWPNADSNISQLELLQSFKRLQSLSLKRSFDTSLQRTVDIRPYLHSFEKLDRISELDLTDCPELTRAEFAPLTRMRSLNTIRYGTTTMRNLKLIASFPNLQTLKLGGAPSTSELSDIAKLSRLRTVMIEKKLSSTELDKLKKSLSKVEIQATVGK